jgi:hypothetical protein
MEATTMLEETNKKSLLQLFAENAEFGTRSYSGRGMYGEECLAVTLDSNQQIGEFVSAVFEQASEEGEIAELCATFESMCQDSMGMGAVIYFKAVKFSRDEDEEDTNEEG